MNITWDNICFEKMVKSGKILSNALQYSISLIKDGVNADFIDKSIEKYILDCGGLPSFKGFNNYKYSSCMSLNEEVVHGIPYKDKILKNGDLVTIDIGVSYEGHCTDAARTIMVGCSETDKLVDTTRRALEAAIEVAVAGNTVGDIGFSIQRTAELMGYNVPLNLGGHGIGLVPHMPPFIPNYGSRHSGYLLPAGMYLAIEPILFEGDASNYVCNDGWTCKSNTATRSAHFEDTVFISEHGPVVLTSLPREI